MNILFDGDILSNYGSGNFARSGIFFVASSLLKEFCDLNETNITVYCSVEKKDLVEEYLLSNQLKLDIKTLFNLPHRRFINWYEKKSENRVEKGLKPLRGIGKLKSCCEALDKLWAYIEANFFREYDVFFSPCEAAPYAIERSGIPIYTIIHDLIPIVTEEFPVKKGYWLYDVLTQVSPEKNYFCISNCTKIDFLKHCPCADPRHVRVVYNGYSPSRVELKETEAKQIIQNVGLKWKCYILILGNVVPHKNVERQINAGIHFIKESGLNDFRIAIVGSCGNPNEILERAQVQNDDRKYLVFCGYVPDIHIRAYYCGAFCLSFTSLYEGFGLPALEAMADGCPVVTSNTSSLPEVVGDAAICISPLDTDAHGAAYTALLNDKKLRNEIIDRGKERVKMFSWEQTARQMMDGMKNDRTI